MGVLMAISIPIFTGQLLKAKVATDQANARAGKAAAVAEALDTQSEGELTYYDDAAKGVVVDANAAKKLAAYDKTSDVKGSDNIEGVTGDTAQDLTKDIVQIVIRTDNTVTVNWIAPSDAK